MIWFFTNALYGAYGFEIEYRASNEECENIDLIGNGFCNDETNNADCIFDGGDCCGSCIITDYCLECTCHDETTFGNEITNILVGNGFCNDETNNEDCNFDGGDCCGPCILKDNCLECSCMDGENSHEVLHPLIGNYQCNDETNTADCDYDGFECFGHPQEKGTYLLLM